MKPIPHTSLFRFSVICILIIASYKCTSPKHFHYVSAIAENTHKPSPSCKMIYLAVTDARNMKGVIGYSFGVDSSLQSVWSTKSDEVTRSIRENYREKLAASGYSFSDKKESSELILELSIQKLQSDSYSNRWQRSNSSKFTTTSAGCRFELTLRNLEGKLLYSTTIYGENKQSNLTLAAFDEIHRTLYAAIDDALTQILDDSTLSGIVNQQ